MRTLIQIAALALLTGCVSPTGPQTGAPVEAVLTERGQLARASVQAARAVHAEEPASPVVALELTHAERLLPVPTGGQSQAAANRAQGARTATPEAQAATYAGLQSEVARLDALLTQARIEEAKRAEAESGRREALMLQTQVTTYAGIGFMTIGVVLGFAGNMRLGVVTLGIGGVLLAASRIIATVPDWAYTVLFISAGLIALIAPVAMWWAYRAGLFQHPPKVGDYEVEA